MTTTEAPPLKRLEAARTVEAQLLYARALFQEMIDRAEQIDASREEREELRADLEEGSVASLMRVRDRLNRALDAAIEAQLRNE